MKLEPVYRKGVERVIGIQVDVVGFIVYDEAFRTVVRPPFQVPLDSVVRVVLPILIRRLVNVLEENVPIFEGFR